MRKMMSSLVVLALLAPMNAPLVAQSNDEASMSRRPMPQHYCRQPSALPILPNEVENQQQAGPVMMRGAGRSGEKFASESESVVVTGSRVKRFDSGSSSPVLAAPPPAASSPPPPSSASSGISSDIGRIMPPRPEPRPDPSPRPQPQSGLLTAGEHDDLLNPELYARYVNRSNLGQSVRDLPRLDTANLLTVEVKDESGRPVAFSQVEVRCSDGNVIALKTMADGKVVFFPEMDRLSSDVSIRAAGHSWRDVKLARNSGATTIGITSRRSAPKVTKLDLMLVVDATGSMSDELQFLKTELAEITSGLTRRHRDLDIRIGFSFYRDKGDQYVTRTRALGRDYGQGQSFLNRQSAGGGGDYPEAMQTALIRAANQDWRGDAVKTLLLVADAPPHDADIPMAWRAAEHLRQDRVHIVPVGASGVADNAEYVMRAMAAATQSRYTFLTDDSGVGNSHAEPSVDCYLVTRLDALLRRVIDSQISGRRIEPDDQEVIRSVGKSNAGRCVLPPSFRQNQ